MVVGFKDASDSRNQLGDNTDNELKELQPSLFVNGDSFDVNSKLYNSNGSSPLSSKFTKGEERSNTTENIDIKSFDDHEVKRTFVRRKSQRCSSDFRRKSSEH